jgi:hypothetical protein
MQLISSTPIPNGLIAAMTLLSEKPRLGFERSAVTLHPGFEPGKSLTALGDNRSVVSGTYQTHVIGRWMSPDPYDGSYRAGNPQSLNRYAYVLNNPLGFVDPTGQDSIKTDDVIINVFADPLPDISVIASWITSGIGYSGGIQAPSKQPCSTSGGGLAVGYGGTASAGVGYAGAEVNAGVGGAAAYSPQNGASAGGYASGGAAAYAGSHYTGAPTQSSNTFVLGAYAGAGFNGSIFHAGSVAQLSGPFNTFTFNIGTGVVGAGVQFSWSGSTWQLSITPPIPVVNPGIGIAGSFTTTKTAVTKHAGCIP